MSCCRSASPRVGGSSPTEHLGASLGEETQAFEREACVHVPLKTSWGKLRKPREVLPGADQVACPALSPRPHLVRKVQG